MPNKMIELKFEREPAEIIAEVLRRFSVLDLREMTDADLSRGDERLAKADAITVIEKGETNLIRWWKIESRKQQYEVRRFENFCFCSCPDFFFTKTVCKHISITTKFYCKRCRRREAEYGRLCQQCSMDTSPILKGRERPKGERIGGILVY